MLRAHVMHRAALCCPACRSDEFVTYRRLPSKDGRILNRCACAKCGVDFEFEEDRTGKPVHRSGV